MKKTIFLTILLGLVSTQGYAQVSNDYVGNGSANDTIRISVDEGTPSAPLKSIYVSDQDRPDTLTISLSGVDASSFTIGNTPTALATTADSIAGTLESSVNFDANAKDKYVISLTATDKGGLSFTAPVSISVNAAEIDSVSLDAYTFAENSTPTFTIAAYRDNGNGTNWVPLNGVTYTLNSITPNSGVAAGTEFSISGNTIDGDFSKTFDFEDVNQWTLNITAERKGVTKTDNYTISVIDANESPFGIGVK